MHGVTLLWATFRLKSYLLKLITETFDTPQLHIPVDLKNQVALQSCRYDSLPVKIKHWAVFMQQ